MVNSIFVAAPLQKTLILGSQVYEFENKAHLRSVLSLCKRVEKIIGNIKFNYFNLRNQMSGIFLWKWRIHLGKHVEKVKIGKKYQKSSQIRSFVNGRNKKQ